MNKMQFLKELEQLLKDLPEADRRDAIAYYEDYFAEAGEENEAAVLEELGSPNKVAETIKAGFREGKETGFAKEEIIEVPEKEKKTLKNWMWVGLAVLLICASPVLFGVLAGAIGVIFGILGAIFGILIALFACGVALPVTGVALIVGGIYLALSELAKGIFLVGTGFFILAIGLVFFALGILLVSKCIPRFFDWITNVTKQMVAWVKGRF